MSTKKPSALLFPAMLLGLAGSVAVAESEAAAIQDAVYLQHIESTYLASAGSADNLANLADGLRNATPITLVDSSPDGTAALLTFTPPTRPMGYGNITHTLDYATRDLAAAGIHSPTVEQLHAALMGGSVTNAAGDTTLLPGVLQLRSQGMGWGKIAHTLGIPPAPNAATLKVPVTAPGAAKGSGIVTAAGSKPMVASTQAKSAKSGIVTAGGHGTAGSKGGNAYGRSRSGIVTAGNSGSTSMSGIVNAHGNSASAGGLAASRVSNAGGSGNGNAFGKVKH